MNIGNGSDSLMPDEALDVIDADIEPLGQSDPGIPFGLASKLMAIVGSGFGLITSIDFIIDGNLTQDSITTMVLAAVSFFVLAGGRYAQAAMKALAGHLDGR